MDPLGNPYEVPGAAEGGAVMEAMLVTRIAQGVGHVAREAWRRLTAPRTPDQRFSEDMAGGAGEMGALLLAQYGRRPPEGQ
ncbi:MAG TPA: hypothetical protein VF466_01210 [Candidatus Saccharimonadales bacterium]